MPASFSENSFLFPTNNDSNRPATFFHGDAFIIFSIFLALVFIFHWQYLTMPPVWDAVAGVFAPAVYLYENNGDYSQLIAQAGYADAGPNVHAFGLVTFLTYFVILLTSGDPTLYLPLLHIIQFVISALTLTAMFGVTRYLLGTLQASLLSACLLLSPVYFVQTSYLYTEIAGAALILFAVMSWATRNYGRVILFSAVACMVKSIGLVLVASIISLIVFDATI